MNIKEKTRIAELENTVDSISHCNKIDHESINDDIDELYRLFHSLLDHLGLKASDHLKIEKR